MAFKASLWSPATSKTYGTSHSFFGCVPEIVLSVQPTSAQSTEVSQGLWPSGLWEVSRSDRPCSEQNISPSCKKAQLQLSSLLHRVGTTTIFHNWMFYLTNLMLSYSVSPSPIQRTEISGGRYEQKTNCAWIFSALADTCLSLPNYSYRVQLKQRWHSRAEKVVWLRIQLLKCNSTGTEQILSLSQTPLGRLQWLISTLTTNDR